MVLPMPLPQLPNTPLCLAKEHGLSDMRTVSSCLQTKQTWRWVTYLHIPCSRQSTNGASSHGLGLGRHANVPRRWGSTTGLVRQLQILPSLVRSRAVRSSRDRQA